MILHYHGFINTGNVFILLPQTALLMKSQLEAVRDTSEERAPDSSITHLIGDTTNMEMYALIVQHYVI